MPGMPDGEQPPSPPAEAARFLPHLRRPGWLGRQTALSILGFAHVNAPAFRPSPVYQDGHAEIDPGRRVSVRLPLLGPFDRLIRDQALASLPEIIAAFHMKPFTPRDVEVELVAHGDGAFFARHRDTAGASDTPGPHRLVTMVYYLHKLPKAFTGGALRYFSIDETSFIDIEAECDEMVAFPSWAAHSVEPVHVSGPGFNDQRFAVNIWIKG